MALSTLADAGPAAWPFPCVRPNRRQVLLQFGQRKKAPALVLFSEFDNGISGDLVRRVHPALDPLAEIEKISNLRALSNAGNADPFRNQAAGFYFRGDGLTNNFKLGLFASRLILNKCCGHDTAKAFTGMLLQL
jgi:hypothetical protein